MASIRVAANVNRVLFAQASKSYPMRFQAVVEKSEVYRRSSFENMIVLQSQTFVN